MNPKFLIKVTLAFALTLSVIFGSGVITEKTGIALVPAAYACSSGTGGGC